VSKQINDCQAKTIVTIPELLPIVKIAKEKCSSLMHIIVVGEEEGCHSFFELLKTDPSSYKLLKGSDINSLKETAVLVYSSGTTVRKCFKLFLKRQQQFYNVLIISGFTKRG